MELVHIEPRDAGIHTVRDAIVCGGLVDAGTASHYINPAEIVCLSVEPGNQLLNKQKVRRQVRHGGRDAR